MTQLRMQMPGRLTACSRQDAHSAAGQYCTHASTFILLTLLTCVCVQMTQGIMGAYPNKTYVVLQGNAAAAMQTCGPRGWCAQSRHHTSFVGGISLFNLYRAIMRPLIVPHLAKDVQHLSNFANGTLTCDCCRSVALAELQHIIQQSSIA